VTLVVLAPLIAALVIAAAAIGLRAQQRQQRALLGRVVQPLAASTQLEPVPSVLFFTGDTCTICHTAQRPALDALAAQGHDRVSIREIDIAREPELARLYRVMSLPTTIVLDPGGQVSAINAGFASVERLRSQLDRIAPAPVAAA
jgi:thioredoxin-like negative regulator of GroEL